ncbi:retrovirus-related pol polyprotein from transposon TNT 1-94, partial [Tanacetum coccineum]
MANLSEDIQCAGSDTRPPMLDKTDFASWQQRIRLYCRGKKNGANILKSIDEGTFQMGTFQETLAECTEGALHLGLLKDIYTIINHYADAKDIWDNVKMLLEGSELTKEDRESQLYDDFEHFRQNKGETIHDYYVRFAKLINDMRNIKMTMSRMQLNSKFVNNMLPEWGRLVTVVKLNRGLRDSNYDQLYAYLKQNEAHSNENKMMLGNNARGAGAAGYGGAQNRVGNANPGQARQVKCYNCNGIGHIARNCTQPKHPQNSEYFKDKMLLMQAQGNGVALDEEKLLFIAGGQDNAINEDVDEQPVQDLALNVDNVFQADNCDAFNSDVDEAPTAQTMFMANLSSTYPVYDEAGPSYDSDILSEVHDHDHYQDAVCEHHEEHEMHDDVQPNYIVDSHANYTSDSNMIPYYPYVKDNAMPVIQSNVSSVPNNAYMMIFNDMHEPHAQYVSDTTRNTVVDNSLTAELATYKEQVELYERRARFELTEREQKIDEQLRIVITDRNIKEENLKKELHSVKMQLASTINHNKLMVEEVTSLKKDFKQKENKYLEEFLDMKALKEKVEDKLYKQDQSLQTVHMLCKPKPYYNEQNKVAIGYKNPLCLTRAKQVQPALYNGYEIIKNHHVPALVHNTEDTLEIVEITRRIMNDKMKDPEYLIKMKEEAFKKQNTASRSIKALTVYPPNTPKTLVPRVLPTKKHFEGIQKALTKEIKEIKDIFEELEADVDQNVVNRKHDEIERKNLLMVNDNLIVDCLSKEMFYIATNSELIVSRFTEMHEAYTIVETRCLELEAELSKLRDKVQKDNHTELVKRFSNLETRSEVDRTLDFKALDFQIIQLTKKVTTLQEQNEFFRAENAKVKQHYKELYDSIKITYAKHIEQTTALTTENRNLKAQIQNKMKSVTKDHVKPTILAPGKYAIDVEPIPPRNRNNREVHLDYLRHLKESVETLREIVEEAKVERPLDRSIVSACRYTKHSQELLEYAIGTCLKDFNQRDKKHAPTPLIRKKQVTFEEQCDTSNSNTHKHVEQLNTQKTNAPLPPSIRVNCCTHISGSQHRSNTKKNRISPDKGVNKMKVEEHPRTNKSHLRTTNRVDSSSSSKRTVVNLNSHSVCQTCNKCLMSTNHDMCVVDYLQYVKAPPSIHNIHNVVRKVKQVWKPKKIRQVWKPTRKVLTSVAHQWRPTCRIFTLGEQCPLTRLTKPKVVSAKQNENQAITCANQQEPNQNWGSNFPNSPSLSIFKCRNDHFGAIMGYGDYVIGESVISRVYYVEGLGHNLFSVRQFCDSDLEVAFRKHSCYVQDTDGIELIKGSRGSNLYTISVEDMMKSSPICLLSKASKNNSWLWHRRLNHLNFGTINNLARKDLVRGLPRLKSKDETPEVVIKFLKQIQVSLNKTVRYIRTDNGTEFVNKDLTEYYERVGIFHQKTVQRTPQQNGIVERRNCTLVKAAQTMLIFSKAPIEDLGKLQPTADIGIFVGYAPSRKGLVPNPVLAAPYVPPTNKELEILFQPMVDEYMEPPRVERPVSSALTVSVL